MKRLRLRKMSWDPRSILYLSQFPLQVNSYMKGEQCYENLGENKCFSCPDLLDAIEKEGKCMKLVVSYNYPSEFDLI